MFDRLSSGVKSTLNKITNWLWGYEDIQDQLDELEAQIDVTSSENLPESKVSQNKTSSIMARLFDVPSYLLQARTLVTGIGAQTLQTEYKRIVGSDYLPIGETVASLDSVEKKSYGIDTQRKVEEEHQDLSLSVTEYQSISDLDTLAGSSSTMTSSVHGTR